MYKNKTHFLDIEVLFRYDLSMKNKNNNVIVKQCAGNLIFFASNRETIEPLNNALFNHGATDDNLRDLGDSANFSWFSCDKDKFLYARAKAFTYNWQKFFPNAKKGGKGGVWKLAQKKALEEFNSYPEETFIVYDNRNYVNPYQFGSIQPSLNALNNNDEIYDGVSSSIKVNIHEIEKDDLIESEELCV